MIAKSENMGRRVRNNMGLARAFRRVLSSLIVLRLENVWFGLNGNGLLGFNYV